MYCLAPETYSDNVLNYSYRLSMIKSKKSMTIVLNQSFPRRLKLIYHIHSNDEVGKTQSSIYLNRNLINLEQWLNWTVHSSWILHWVRFFESRHPNFQGLSNGNISPKSCSRIKGIVAFLMYLQIKRIFISATAVHCINKNGMPPFHDCEWINYHEKTTKIGIR